MNWINTIVIVLVISCLTGSLAVGLWKIIQYLPGKFVNARYRYLILRAVILSFVLPMVFMSLYILREVIAQEYRDFSLDSTVISLICRVGVSIWSGGILVILIYQFSRFKTIYQITRKKMYATAEQKALLQDLCTRLKIRKKIRLYQGYRVRSPFIMGIIRTTIYLPRHEFQKEDLEMILYHELMHYKQKDVLWRPVFALIRLLYWFNPLFGYLRKEIEMWSEASCDAGCCEKKFTAKKYFGRMMLINEAIVNQEKAWFAPMWCEDNRNLKWRVQMMKSMKNRTRKRGIAALIIAVSLVMSAVSTKAAMRGVELGYGQLFWNTIEATEEPSEQDQVPVDDQEYTGDISDLGDTRIIEEEGPVFATRSNTYFFEWTVNDGTTHTSSQFSVNAGQTIRVVVDISPANKVVKIGLMKGNKKISFINNKGTVTHDFKIAEKGNYKLFISNSSESKVEVTGTVIKR